MTKAKLKQSRSTDKLAKQDSASNSESTEKFLRLAGFFSLCMFGMVDTVYADWFQVGQIRTNLINPVYGLVNDNLGFIAFAVGGVTTFFARGQDMYQKGIAFGIGSLGTAASVKLAQTVLHLG
jgi:hypothetical protein